MRGVPATVLALDPVPSSYIPDNRIIDMCRIYVEPALGNIKEFRGLTCAICASVIFKGRATRGLFSDIESIRTHADTHTVQELDMWLAGGPYQSKS